MSELTVTALESAINYWRQRSPSEGDDLRLCHQASALAVPYARMIVEHLSALQSSELEEVARQAWYDYLSARNQTP